MRATAIILMVAFHFVWDLNLFGYIKTDIPNGFFWKELRALIVSLFLFSVGASLVFSFKEEISQKKLTRRLIKISGAAFLVTLSSLITLTNNWIYFGVLHFIVVATVMLVWFVNKPNLALFFSMMIFAVDLSIEIPKNWPFNYIESYLPQYTNDLVTPFPWLALPLLGVWAAHIKRFQQTSDDQGSKFQFVTTLSKNSLVIYLIHQPLFFAVFYVLAWVNLK
jgi:uncharacterized membrane protein